MSPVDHYGPVTGSVSLWPLRENISPVSEMRKGDEFWRVIRKNKAKMAKHKVVITFAPIIP